VSPQFLVTLSIERTTGFGLSDPNGAPKPPELDVVVMNRPTLAFSAVFESPNRSQATPSRGDRSFHCGRGDVLNVDERRCSAYGDRFRNLSNLQVHTDRRRERGRQLDALAPNRAEAGQTECHRIDTRAKIEEAVGAVIAGHHRAQLFDEYRTRRLDGDTGQHAAT
jgi:hypothetical protein